MHQFQQYIAMPLSLFVLFKILRVHVSTRSQPLLKFLVGKQHNTVA